MPDYTDLLNLVKGPMPSKPLPGVWGYFPCFAGAVGGVPDYVEYYLDVDVKLHLQRKFKQNVPKALVLPGIFADFGVVVEASAFGGQLRWFKQGTPHINRAIYDLKEIDSLKVPEAGLAGLMPLVLNQREIMRRKLKQEGVEMEKWGSVMGPAEISGLLLGYDKFYMALYEDPVRIKRLMEITTELVINWLHLKKKSYGGLEVLCVADHVCNQVTPEQLEEFIAPFEKAIFAEFPEAIRIYHNEGLHAPEHVEMILDFGAEIWHFGSDQHEVSELYPLVGDRIVLFGGLDPHGPIRFDTPDDVRRETLKVIEASRNRRLLLSSGTGTTPETTLENILAMVETTADYQF